MKRLACVFTLLLSVPASAQSISCADRESVVARLTGLGEAQSGLGLATKGQVFEIWAAPEVGTWTIVLSHSNGLSCIMAYGSGWTGLTPQMAALPDAPT